MATNPRPWLIAIAAVDLVALGIVLVYQLTGQPQLAPLSGMLTALFAAFLAAIIALSTIDYLNERGQIREWNRDETLSALRPIYEEIVANTGSFPAFHMGSTFAWDELQKQARRIYVPESVEPALGAYYGRTRSHQGTYTRAWNVVKRMVHETFESEFKSKIPDARSTDIANLVMECWSQIVDGNPHIALLERDKERYKALYEEVARGSPVRPAEVVLRELKAAISKEEKVTTLQVGAQTRLDESKTMLATLRPVLLRPWEFAAEEPGRPRRHP